MSKRRARGGAGGVQSAVSQLVVKHRELNENEKKAEVRKLRDNHDFTCIEKKVHNQTPTVPGTKLKICLH